METLKEKLSAFVADETKWDNARFDEKEEERYIVAEAEMVPVHHSENSENLYCLEIGLTVRDVEGKVIDTSARIFHRNDPGNLSLLGDMLTEVGL